VSGQPTFEDMMVRLVAEAMGHKSSELADAFGGYLCACERASWSQLAEFGDRGGCPAGWADARAVVTVWPPELARQPGGIIGIPSALSDAEFQQFERRWREKHTGTRNAHRVKLLGRHPWPWWKRAYCRARRWLS
jgi:hypothetical protein